MTQLKDLTAQARLVIEKYKEQYPAVAMDRNYLPFKITEEWGECMQAYLMLTDRGRQKGKTKEEISELFSQECADIFGYLLLFADNEGVDLAAALKKKWFAYLKPAA
ncbi:MAG: pyrophosphatase [Candidatus Pacebacteria bacterium]|nr:pyrophosphatase [Candidatus Paceibacterota bacterium]